MNLATKPLQSIIATTAEIPFKQVFSHSSASREQGQSLWVEVCDHAGNRGLGEGCPREYVTGETLQSTLDFVATHTQHWREEIVDLASLRVWLELNRDTIDQHPAAWSAVELALLDCFAQASGCSVEALLGLPELSGRFSYSAVIGDASTQRFALEVARYVKAGFVDFKIKLSGDLQRDQAKIKALKTQGVTLSRVRADANNLWASAVQAIGYLHALGDAFKVLEEPLGVNDYQGMEQLASAARCSIIVDESFLRIQQLTNLNSSANWIINLRISKMGGLIRSLALVDAIRQSGHSINIGAHVGETSLLTRAALCLANVSRDVLVAQEGAFGTHLLAYDRVEPCIMFGAGGVLDSDTLNLQTGAGFGLRLRQDS